MTIAFSAEALRKKGHGLCDLILGYKFEATRVFYIMKL